MTNRPQSDRSLRLLKISFIILSLVTCALIFAPRMRAAGKPSREVISSLKRAVVIITTFDSQGKPLLQGSGFFIKTDCIVTALHVIKGAVQIRITTFDGKTSTAQSVISSNEKTDLALLQMENSLTDSFLELADGNVRRDLLALG